MPDEDTERKDVPEDELEAKLADIEEKGRVLRSSMALPEPPEWNYKRPAQKDSGGKDSADNYYQAGVGISVAYSLIGSIIAGWGIGKLIDMQLKTNGIGQGLGTLIGAVLGLTASIFLIIKAQSRTK